MARGAVIDRRASIIASVVVDNGAVACAVVDVRVGSLLENY